jgi:membrane protein CcdC involved in cytochrome C biogenesis
MRLHISDWKWACIDAVCLLGIALFVVFVINPGGFEGQGVWLFLLLPGSFPAYVLSDLVYKLAPSAESFTKWALIVGFNFGWYWLISYAMIKIFRAGGWQLGSPDF